MEIGAFELKKTEGKARRGAFQTAHGLVQTPVFMNVGTAGAIKGAVDAFDLKELGCQVELSNTYHLHVRPGDAIVKQMGGLHKFMRWDGPMLTDSGGFQVFSLASLRKIREEGVTFNSHVDGRKIFMGPEESMRIQSNLGSDIAMAFDECIENPAPYEYVKDSCARTTRWLVRCKEEMARLNSLPDTVNPHQLLFGINQGGTYDDLRVAHMEEIAKLDLPGYAIGGLAVGESTDVMYHILDVVLPHAPEHKPRYLMGVGTPSNIIEGVARGIDFFDCVMPTRNARHGHLFTWDGIMNIHNAKYQTDDRPIEEGCQCPTCRKFSRAYVRHLLKAGEMLSQRLLVQHNLWFYNNLMVKIREALDQGTFAEFRAQYSEKLAKRI
ncbi:tRNA guanosine(34) transglycosylase Tgt [Butyricicoccus pullicaecorum]|uniref:Queuine tRNA-ribosyltransferase n=1 Tax=Butyricicoccus pullicaecorum 1.2 TaxID=1203606 RepID=R8W4N0_9FIRM|nr:tRNA guanosine(34) transglycosylase Tgt [Butyricicoccus pullicaecorum]EOQ39674.1 queuine tRNA-ribosyltransferase [Butyricicoccus pullicaecorum 1.2]SKA56972.1 queuine tRNA-ribosyltransferase [Butyricicoccus pullicaecorum DSM 23266]HJF52693.1 tRNA guanosine(34) transglycosylase Tgt [Butyricicoccus pullicaecorum]